MEWIRISRNKLKIMLTAEDARRYDLRPRDASLESALTRRAFRAILNDAGKETGFDAADERVYIQLFPSREGGCELFVTREKEGEDSPVSPPCPQSEKKAPPKEERRHLAFCFPSFPTLLSACRRLREGGYRGESTAHKEDAGRYWLLLSDKGNPLSARKEYRFLLEYGEMEHAEHARMLLPEHSAPLCASNAVETLGTL